ncbi:MAG: hypothetical protein P4L53_03730 [Candidatus Obscuribacterales bacterium]|nr:hypothetical protein [Candidatus Obscuribacterales bacterium]
MSSKQHHSIEAQTCTPFLEHYLSGTTNGGNLPPDLVASLGGLGKNCAWPRPIDDASFAHLVEKLIDMLVNYDRVFSNAYHNVKHSVTVFDRLDTVLAKTSYPAVVMQALQLAALAHDLAHPGATLRRDAIIKPALPELGNDVSNERVSGLLLDQFLALRGVDVQIRAMAFVLIQATTFGAAVEIHTDIERMLAIADIAPSGSFIEWVYESLAVERESPVEKRPSSLEEWIVRRLAFTNFIQTRLLSVGVEVGNRLPYRIYTTNLGEIRRVLFEVQQGVNPAMAKVLEAIVTPILSKHSPSVLGHTAEPTSAQIAQAVLKGLRLDEAE